TAADTVLNQPQADTVALETADTAQADMDTVAYDADKIQYGIQQNLLLLTGNCVVTYQNMRLFADTIHYLLDDDLLLASGAPQLIEGTDTIVGETMVYNLETGRGKVRYATARSGGGGYTGIQIAKGDSSTFFIDQGDYTSCALIDTPHYFFYSRNIKVTPGDKAISRPIILNIGDAPVAALPYYILPLERGRQSGFLRPSWGGNINRGGYLDNLGYYWAINDYMDLSVSGKIQEFQDFIIQSRGRYALRYWLSGFISGRYAQSRDDIGESSTRWSLDYRHDQNLVPDASLRLSGRGNLVSDRSFYTEFSEDSSELLNQRISANLSLSKRFSSINASGSINWDREQNLQTEIIDEVLPSANFSLPNRPLIPQSPDAPVDQEPAWYNRIYYSYNARATQKRRLYTGDSLDIADITNQGITQSVNLSAPLTVFRWFTINPSFSARLTGFDAFIDTTDEPRIRTRFPVTRIPATQADTIDTLGPPDTSFFEDRGDSVEIFYGYVDTVFDTLVLDTFSEPSWVPPSYQAAISMSTRLYGIFPIKIFNFTGMRHTLSPSVSYNFVPERNIDRLYPGFLPWTGSRDQAQSVSFSVGNLFEGKMLRLTEEEKKPEERRFTILSGDVSASYDFETESGERAWSDIGISARTSYSIFNVSFSSSFRPYDVNNELVYRPNLMNYSISIRPNNLSAGGSLWGGDLFVLEGIYPENNPVYADAGMQSWNISFNPSYSYRRSRTSLEDDFVTDRSYSLRASAGIGFTRSWSASWNGYYNFETNRLEGHALNFDCDLECWQLDFNWRPSGYNPGFEFSISIKEHPDIKWERRD
ncbi:MAG: LPS-assembly protein LptD, partial [Chitinivibrionales bacterium]